MGRIILVLSLLIFFAGCSKDNGQLTAKQEQQIIEIGEHASQALQKNLKEHLMEAFNAGETVDAIEFCAASAIQLTEEVQESLDSGIQLKRTSSKFRNPKNAPDPYEKAALRYFDSLKTQGQELPPYLIEPVPENSEYRYYQPILVGELCLKCHGDPAQMEDPVKETLITNYPGDTAIGYKTGDFRGLVRVSIPSQLVLK